MINFMNKTNIVFYPLLTILILFIFANLNASPSSSTFSSDTIKRNAIVIEVYKPLVQVSGPISFQFERLLGRKGQTALSFGFTPYISNDDRFQYYTFPISLTRITSPLKSSHFEFGISLLFAKKYGHFGLQSYNIPLMYRYQNNSRFFMAAGIKLIPFGLYPTPTLKIGFRF